MNSVSANLHGSHRTRSSSHNAMQIAPEFAWHQVPTILSHAEMNLSDKPLQQVAA
jgi:hypothetical protein